MGALIRFSGVLRSLRLAVAILPWVSAMAQPAMRLPDRSTFYVTPTVEGLYVCDEGLANPQLKDVDAVNSYCILNKLDGAAGVTRLLDQLEPGGPKGQVQVGYVATLHWLANGHPAASGYFGYRIVPYTLQTDERIPVNHYRYEALRHVAKRLNALPKAVHQRIIAITLAGELHHMFPDFEGGTGKYRGIAVTDYSASSVSGFRSWLAQRYGSIANLNARHGFSFASFDMVPAPGKDIRKDKLNGFAEHCDAFADGLLPIAGWLWDPQQRIERLDLYIDAKPAGPVERGLGQHFAIARLFIIPISSLSWHGLEQPTLKLKKFLPKSQPEAQRKPSV